MPEKEVRYRLGDKELSDSLCTGLVTQANLLQHAGTAKLPGRAQGLNVLLLTSARTTGIIADLGKGDYLNEAVMLARSVIERCVNYCYLLYCGDDEYERFWQYSHQKMYRRLSSSVEAAGYRFVLDGSSWVDLDKNPQLKQDVEAFTSGRGREITRWTKTSVIDRVNLVCSESGVNPLAFLLNMTWIYEDASEALHGTFYGCTFDTGVLPSHQAGDLREEGSKHRREHISLLAVGLHDMLHSVLEVIQSKYDLGELISYSRERSAQLRHILKLVLSPNEEEA